MGYHVNILRGKEPELSPILKSEIEELVKHFPDLRIERPISKSAELDLVISKDGADISRFTLQDGKIWTKNPDEIGIQAMINIAKYLGARVRGDEFETYESLDNTYIHPEDRDEARFAQEKSAAYLTQHNRTKTIWWIIKVVSLLMLIIGIIISHKK
jgi:hypothetical protein